MLRVGIILDSYTTSAWISEVISEIQSSNSTIALAIVVGEKKHDSDAIGAANSGSPLLFRWYERWDYRRNKTAQDALESADISPLLRDTPILTIQPATDGVCGHIVDDQFEQIEAYDLDVLVCFASRPPRGKILDAARYGLWSAYPYSEENDCAAPALFWSVFDRSPVCESGLQVQTTRDEKGFVAFSSYSSVDHASLFRTRNPVYWKAGELILRGLRELNECGADFVRSSSRAKTALTSDKRMLRNYHMLRFFLLEISRWLKSRLHRLRASAPAKWCIGVRSREPDLRFDSAQKYALIASPADRFYADPFLFEQHGRTFLFFEDFRYSEGRAVISCCELQEDGIPSKPVEVLRRPYHLSYPFIFEEEDEIYMIPETRGNKTVEMYRATEFPYKWSPAGVLLNEVYAVDTTLQRVMGKLWMFTGMSNGKYSNSDELSIYSASSIKGPWVAHPCNPVVSDVRCARPAGKLFYEDGRLIRPSQDCGKAYGYGLVFSEILTLSESEYEERPLSRINPESVPHALANHTYNRTQSFEVIDRTVPAMVADRAETS